MPAYSGVNLNAQWIQAAATTVLSGDYRTLNYAPSIDLLDESAGADATKLYIAAQKDGQASFASLLQTGSGAGGTAMAAALVEGAVGTLIWSPEGTAAAKPKYTLPAISQGASFNYQYAGLSEFSVNFQQNGLRVEGTN
jgi:hypothetical protein